MTSEAERGYHLATAATLRMLSKKLAEVADGRNPDAWFLQFGQEVFDYVDATTNPRLDKPTERGAKEAAYAMLRMIFE
jgi:hypothetical protein